MRRKAIRRIDIFSFLMSVVTRGESTRSRQAESERHPVRDGAGVNGLSPSGDASRFESMLSESFGE